MTVTELRRLHDLKSEGNIWDRIFVQFFSACMPEQGGEIS